jgi:hypothetical protein
MIQITWSKQHEKRWWLLLFAVIFYTFIMTIHKIDIYEHENILGEDIRTCVLSYSGNMWQDFVENYWRIKVKVPT